MMSDIFVGLEGSKDIITDAIVSRSRKGKMDHLCPNHSRCLVVWASQTGDTNFSYLEDYLRSKKRVSVGVITSIGLEADADDVCHLELLKIEDGRAYCVDGMGQAFDYSLDCVVEYEVEGGE